MKILLLYVHVLYFKLIIDHVPQRDGEGDGGEVGADVQVLLCAQYWLQRENQNPWPGHALVIYRFIISYISTKI